MLRVNREIVVRTPIIRSPFSRADANSEKNRYIVWNPQINHFSQGHNHE